MLSLDELIGPSIEGKRAQREEGPSYSSPFDRQPCLVGEVLPAFGGQQARELSP